MRFIHTADWHIGHELFGHSRSYEHECFLTWLLGRCVEHQPDGLILAGDVFHHANPSNEALQQFAKFADQLRTACRQTTIIAVAGNHDSPARFDALMPLVRDGVHLVGSVSRNSGRLDVDRLLVPCGDGCVLAAPYLRLSDLPTAGDRHGIADRMATLYTELWEASAHLRTAKPCIVTGHLHVLGGEVSESERPTLVGGEDAAAIDIFPTDAAYVALGHLHKAQSLDNGRVRYSGSPIPLSATERVYKHQVALVDITKDGARRVEILDVPRAIPHLRVPTNGDVVPAEAIDHLQALAKELGLSPDLPEHLKPFVEFHLDLQTPMPRAAAQLIEDVARSAVPVRVVKVITASTPSTQTPLATSAAGDDLASHTPYSLFPRAFFQTHQCEPAAEHLAVFNETIKEVMS